MTDQNFLGGVGPAPCPTCGRCPTCGKGGSAPAQPYQPLGQYQPYTVPSTLSPPIRFGDAVVTKGYQSQLPAMENPKLFYI
jgi:hypothetical protein